MLRLSPLTEPAATVRESRSRSSAPRYRDDALPPPETKNPAKSSGCVSNFRSPSGSVTHGCLLRVQKWTVALSHEVSSNVPARTKRSTPPILGVPVSHVPQSEQTQRVVMRLLSARRCTRCGSPAVRWNASSVTTTAMEKALLVIFWQSVQWQLQTSRGASITQL